MHKALIIGCGNIGALYDIENEQVLTHAKAFSLHSDFDFSVYDINPSLAEQIALKYKVNMIENIDLVDFSSYDAISICSPTNTHYAFLEKALKAKVKVVICEKPVSNKMEEIEKLISLYNESESKVLVNYMRRFQHNYFELKDLIQTILKEEILTNISIRYQRGFINNCSHALDLIQYLTGNEIKLENIQKGNLVYDHFDSDPTLSIRANWNSVNVDIMGLSNVKFSLFEIDLFFLYHRISITSSGQNILIYKSTQGEKNLQPLVIQNHFSKENSIKDYMKPVINHAYSILMDKTKEDNFLSAAILNRNMLNYLKS